MSRVLTSDGRWIDDGRIFLREESSAADGGAVLPLSLWKLGGRAGDAVWLAPADEPSELVGDLERLRLIGIDFPKFTDGRGFSIASLLRRRYGYTADLRAIGDVLVDQLHYLRRVGFSSFALKAAQDEVVAVRALNTFSEHYQGSADNAVPAFRRADRPFAEIR